MLSVLLAAAILAQSPPREESLITERYEVYGPSSAAVQNAVKELDTAAGRFTRYFGEAPPKVAIYLIESPADAGRIDISSFARRGVPVLPFPIMEADQMRSKVPASIELQVLAHEACHVFLIAYVDQRLPPDARPPSSLSAADPLAGILSFGQPQRAPVSGDKYGHPAIADWLDEAAAMICESDAMLDTRRKNIARAETADVIPFAELTAMPHPNVGKLSSERTLVYYDEIYSLVQFLSEREGPQTLGKIVRLAIAGTPLPYDWKTLEREWRQWVKK